MTDPREPALDRSHGAIAEYRATIAIYPESAVLEPEPAFSGWTTFVSHRSVRAIAVAPESRIVWIATWGGVLAWNRTDAYVYRRYSSEHGLAGTPSCITVADDDRPWVGHTEGGLSWFDAGRWHPYEYLRHDSILALAAARDGRVWVATPNSIALVERNRKPVEIVRGDSSCANATALLSDGDRVLIALPSGLFRVGERSPVERVSHEAAQVTALARAADGSIVAGTLTGVFVGDTLVAPNAGDPAVVSVAPSRSGIWALTRSGIARIEAGQWLDVGPAPDGLAAARVLAVARPTDDYLWIGTDDLVSGLRPAGDSPWDIGVLPRHDEDALSNLGRCIVADDMGRVWIGTAGGLFRGEPDGSWVFDAELGDVRSVMIARKSYGVHDVWVLGSPAGAYRITMPGRVLEPFALPPGLARGVIQGYDWRPYAWIGSRIRSLDEREPQAEVFHVPPHARIVVQAPGLTWYAATDQGLFRYDRVASSWSLESDFGVATVTALATLAVWLFAGTNGAFWMLDARGWRKLELQHEGTAWTEPVTTIARCPDNESVWVGCGGRVARCTMEEGRVLKVYDRFDSGVCGNNITAISELDGVLWVVSRAGIARHVLKR